MLVKVEENQSVHDIAIAYYGTLEAVGEIITLNPELRNDKTALTNIGVDAISNTSFYIDVALEVGMEITIDTDSRTIKTEITRELTTPQTKYTNG